MAVLWRLIAVFIALINSVEEWQCSGLPQNGQNCGPCWCWRVERSREVKVECTSRNLTTIPAEIPEDVTAL